MHCTDRAWNANQNGIKRIQGLEGGYDSTTAFNFFGVVNLLAPRNSLMRPYYAYWNEHYTVVQVRAAAPSAAFRVPHHARRPNAT